MASTSLDVVYEYVEEVDQNLMCSICRSALVDPVTTTSCKHTFCKECIHQSLLYSPRCPIDRSALSMALLQPTETLVQLMLDELIVKCTSEACGKVMQRALLPSHTRTCQNGVVFCGEQGCGLSMKREGLPQHRAYECFQRKMECDTCGVIITFHNSKAHLHADESSQPIDKCTLCGDEFAIKQQHNWICPKARVPCSHATIGCNAIIPRAELHSHLESCVFEKVAHLFKAEKARYDGLVKAIVMLERRGTFIQSRLDALRNQFGELDLRSATELGSLQSYVIDRLAQFRQDQDRREEVSNVAVVGRPRHSISFESLHRTTGVAAWDQGGRSQVHRRGSSAELRGQEGRGATRTNPFNFNFSSLRRTDAAAAQGNSTPQVPASATASDAPVPSPLAPPDTSSRTDDETRGMVESVTLATNRLAAGMDSLVRRNHVSRVTDGLRLAEEVASLRAIVNTLRLEVMRNRPTVAAQNTPDRPSRPTLRTLSVPVASIATSDIPFAAYVSATVHPNTPSSPDARRIPLDSDEDNADENQGPDGERGSVRESVLFRNSTAPSTASLVSTVSSGATGQARGRRRALRGRPMGIPPPTDEEGPQFGSPPRTSTSTAASLGMRLEQPEGETRTEGSLSRPTSRMSLANPISRLGRRLRDGR